MKLIRLAIVMFLLFIGVKTSAQSILWQPQGSFEMQNIRSLGAFGIPVKDTSLPIGFTNRDSVGCLRMWPLNGLVYVKYSYGWGALAPVSLVNAKLNISDTLSMLSSYLRKGDTANMLLPYLRKNDTASISNRVNLRVRYIDTSLMLLPYLRKSDTSAMLSPYLRKSDTSSLSNQINLKLNISDTALMLSKYLRKSDTTTLSNRINTKLNISDTTSMLSPYLRKGDTANMLINYVRSANNGLTKSGQSITLGGTLSSPTTISTGAQSFNIFSTSAITGGIKFTTNNAVYGLYNAGVQSSGLVLSTDGATYVTNQFYDAGTKGLTYFSDYSSIGKLDPLWIPSYAAVLSAIHDTALIKLNKTDTSTLSNRINTKVNISDTASMLSAYLRKGDTTNMLSPYLRKLDTASLSTRINAKEAAITSGTTAQYWRGDKTFQTLQISAVANGTLQGITANSTIDSTNRIIKITGSTGSLTGTGPGLEMYWSGTSSTLQSYNRLTSAVQPIAILGSTISLAGGVYADTRNVTASATATVSDFKITVNNVAIATITLPPAAGSNRQILIIKKLSGIALNVTIQANAAELIDGTNTKVLTLQYSSLMIQSDGTKWDILAAYATGITL